MKLAIMQPYFFPYIGYWQLIHAVDRFVIYDDVNYIKGGWINRNRILMNGRPGYLTVPLRHLSPNRKICEIKVDASQDWRSRLIRSVENTYRRAPCFDEVFPLVKDLIGYDTDDLSDYLAHQIRTLAGFMGSRTELVMSSRGYANSELTGQMRILDICRREGATIYINPQGGRALYDADAFHDAGIELCFLFSQSAPYRQRTSGFVPGLSVIDMLMEIGPPGMKGQLDAYKVVTGDMIHAL